MVYYLWATLLVFICLCGWTLNLIGLPGNWVMVVAAALFSYFFPGVEAEGLGWTVVGMVTIFAVGGELLEMGASAITVTKGGSKKGAICGVIGSFLGSVLGAVVGLPIPVVGPVIGVILFAAGGAMGGTIIGELWEGRNAPESLMIGKFAFWGRVFGAVGKILIGSIILSVITVAALFA